MRNLLLCGVLAFTPAPLLAQNLAIDHSGVWLGQGVQPDGQSWEIMLTLRADGAIVDYPSVPCSAFWSFSEVTSQSLRATEHLAAGFDACEDGLSLTVMVDAKGSMTVTWTYPDATSAATARLTRQ